MKTSELREKSTENLKSELHALLKEQFNLRMQKGVGQSPKSHLFKQVRAKIARLMTILHEKGSSV